MTLYSYVVEHDNGYAPNPYHGFCTLVQCKISKSGIRKNIVELADKDDWIVGTGGNGIRSAGHGKIVYAMRVDERLPLRKFQKDKRFIKRDDNKHEVGDISKRFALISYHYFYFGKNAVEIDKIEKKVINKIDHPLEKKGPGFRKDFNEEFVQGFINWIEKIYQPGRHGDPCGQKLIIRGATKEKSKTKCN